jgi:hypothetical protein
METTMWWIILFTILVLFYFIPTIIAWSRWHIYTWLIWLLNLIFWITIIWWFLLMFVAMWGQTKQDKEIKDLQLKQLKNNS